MYSPYRKYNNQPVWIDGIKFDSGVEGQRYRQLKMMQDVGLISGLTLQPKVTLIPSFKHKGKTIRAVTYSADFKYLEDGHEVWEDVKGVETEAFKLKYKWMLSKGYDLRVLKYDEVMRGAGHKSKSKAVAKGKGSRG